MSNTRRLFFQTLFAGAGTTAALAAREQPKPEFPKPIDVPEHVDSSSLLTSRYMNQIVDGLAQANEILKHHGLVSSGFAVAPIHGYQCANGHFMPACEMYYDPSQQRSKDSNFFRS
jgi:hypothetical protein